MASGWSTRRVGHLVQLSALLFLCLPMRGVAGNPAGKRAVLVQLVEEVGGAVHPALRQLQRRGRSRFMWWHVCVCVCVCACAWWGRGRGRKRERGWPSQTKGGQREEGSTVLVSKNVSLLRLPRCTIPRCRVLPSFLTYLLTCYMLHVYMHMHMCMLHAHAHAHVHVMYMCIMCIFIVIGNGCDLKVYMRPQGIHPSITHIYCMHTPVRLWASP